MGSIEAMTKGSEKRYFASGAPVKVAQGVSGAVVDKGSLRIYLNYLIQGRFVLPLFLLVDMFGRLHYCETPSSTHNYTHYDLLSIHYYPLIMLHPSIIPSFFIQV